MTEDIHTVLANKGLEVKRRPATERMSAKKQASLIIVQPQLCHTSEKIQCCIYTWWPKKYNHYQESSLNRIKNCQCGYISHQL